MQSFFIRLVCLSAAPRLLVLPLLEQEPHTRSVTHFPRVESVIGPEIQCNVTYIHWSIALALGTWLFFEC